MHKTHTHSPQDARNHTHTHTHTHTRARRARTHAHARGVFFFMLLVVVLLASSLSPSSSSSSSSPSSSSSSPSSSSSLVAGSSAPIGPAFVAPRVAHWPVRDVAFARNAPTLPLSARRRCVRHPPRRSVHSRGHKGPCHLDVRTQTRARALHPTLVAGAVARLANWRDHAADPRHVHVPAHLGSVTTALEGAPPPPPAGRVLGVADPGATLRQRVRAAVHIPGADRFPQDQDLARCHVIRASPVRYGRAWGQRCRKASAEQAHATRRTDGTRCPTACMPLGRVGVRRRVGHVQLRGPCVGRRGGVAR